MDAARVTGGDDADDELLMSELRALAARHDPVPPEAVAAARSAIVWRTMGAELAELTVDASLDPQLAGVRAVDVPTLLTFEAASLTVELEVIVSGDGRSLVGQLVPPGPAELQVRHRRGTLEVVADEIGRFAADGVSPGPVSLRCRMTGGTMVETDWFVA